MRALGTVLMVVAAVALVAFPILYHIRTHGGWRDNAAGKSLMAFQAIIGLVMILAVWSAISHGHLPDVVRPLVWLAISYVAWRQVFTLIAAQRRPGRHERSDR